MDNIDVMMAGTIEREENSVSKVTKNLVKKYRIVMRGVLGISKDKSFFVSIYCIPNYLYNRLKYQQQVVFCECFMEYDGYHVKKNNLGRRYKFVLLRVYYRQKVNIYTV